MGWTPLFGTDFNGNAASYLYDGLNAVQETHGSTATSILTGFGGR